VPQAGQVPEVAGLLFFIVIALGFFISFLVRHLTQYASTLHLLLNRKIYYFASYVNRFEAKNRAKFSKIINFLKNGPENEIIREKRRPEARPGIVSGKLLTFQF
jgi:hypothetical protein